MVVEWRFHSRQAGTTRRATNPQSGGHRPKKTAPTTRCNGRWATSSLVCVPAALRECRVPGLHGQAGTPRGRPSRGTAGTNPKTGGHQPKDWQALPFNTVGDHEFFLAFGKCVSEIVRGSFWYVGIGRHIPIVLSCCSLRLSSILLDSDCPKQSPKLFQSVCRDVRLSALSLQTERAGGLRTTFSET